MLTFIDQTNEQITLHETPQRIISIVPSQSEFLWEIGLRDELVGITKFCIHPDEMFETVKRVGGTKKLDIAAIRALKPDLIIGNKEENEKSDIDELRKEFNVWMSDIFNFDDSIAMMRSLGEILGKKAEAEAIVTKVQKILPGIRNAFTSQKVLYFIWKDPYMVAAANTYIHHVLQYLGFRNAAAHLQRYPELTAEQVTEIKPNICFLSSEPYPFKEKHIEEMQRLLPECRVVIVDGEVFSWYGSRILALPEYLEELKGFVS